MQWANGMFTAHEIADARTPEPPLVVHLTRVAGLLTLLGGVIMLIAGNAGIGVAIILLSALYFALAEIIRYLAVIARGSSSHED
jgi:predicted ATP-dependent serine protease